jgi:hypothetical protein
MLKRGKKIKSTGGMAFLASARPEFSPQYIKINKNQNNF